MSKYKRVNLVFSRETDLEILEIIMSKQNMSAYIKDCIRHYERLQEFKIDRKTLKEVIKEAVRESGVTPANITKKSIEIEEGISDDIIDTILNM